MNELNKDFKGFIKIRFGYYRILQVHWVNRDTTFNIITCKCLCTGFSDYKIDEISQILHLDISDGKIITEAEYEQAKLKKINDLISKLTKA